MDPNATIDRLYDIVFEGGDADEARDLAENLRTWFANGGFAPDNDRLVKLAKVTQRLVEDFWL